MSSGERLYLILVVGVFAAFAAVIAYYSWRQAVADRAAAGLAPSRPAAPVPAHGVHA